MSHSQPPLSELSLSVSLSLAQPSATGPTIRITVKNTSQDETYTILKWSSPLDPLALALGLVSVTVPSQKEGPGTPFDIPHIMLKRAMPPPPDAFVTLSPGESESHDIVLREPAVGMTSLISAAKAASGEGDQAPPVVNVQIVCGISEQGDDEDQGGAVVWRGKTKEDLPEEDVLSLGRRGENGEGAVRWRVTSNVLRLELGS